MSHAQVAEFSPEVRIVQVKVGKHWLCAELDRSERVEVERMLIRQVVPTDWTECAECTDA